MLKTTIFTKDGNLIEKEWKKDTGGRQDFDKICADLGKQKIVVLKKVTLQDLINFSNATSREVAVFYNKKKSLGESDIVVFASRLSLKEEKAE